MRYINNGGSAFPSQHPWPHAMPGSLQAYGHVDYPGMTLRDYFAGQALVGLCAQTEELGRSRMWFAERSYCIADALLKQREEQ